MGYFPCKFKMALYGKDLTGKKFKIDNYNINPGDSEWEGLPDRVYFEGKQVYAQGSCQPPGQFWLARNKTTQQYFIRYGTGAKDAYFLLTDLNGNNVMSIPEIEENGGNGNGGEEEQFDLIKWVQNHPTQVVIYGGLGVSALIIISKQN